MAVEDNLPHATAQTLNHALGNLGGRQKSWMQSAAPTIKPSELAAGPLPFSVRRRGRPPKNPASTTAARPTIEPQAETQPPSNSTSPQLANVVTRQDNAAPSASVITVFPSPTPSEEPMNTASVPAPRGANGTSGLDFFDLSPHQANYAPDKPLETVFMDEARRAHNASKRPSEDSSYQTGKRVRSGQEQPRAVAGATVQPQSLPPTPQDPEFPRRPSNTHAQVLNTQHQQVHQRSPSWGQISAGAVQSPQLYQGVHVHPVRQTPPQGQAPFGPPRALSRGTAQHPTDVPAEAPLRSNLGPFSNVPFVNLQSTWYTKGECLQSLTNFQATYAVSPDHPRDGRRINVLKDATEMEDWPYLIMHQFYCLLSFNPRLLPVEIRNLPGMENAVRVMQAVLDANDRLSPAVLHFFCNFPHPLDEIRAMWPATLSQQEGMFVSFVTHSHNYEPLKLTCERRRFPPVAWELAHYLGLSSRTFQRLLFTAILRCIWRGLPQNSRQAKYEGKAVGLFQRDQCNYYGRIVALRDGRRPDSAQIAQDNQTDLVYWGDFLKQVVEEYERDTHQQGYLVSAPSDAAPSFAPQQPGQAQHPHQDPRTVTNATNMPPHSHRTVQPHTGHNAVHESRGRGRPRMQQVPSSRVLSSQQPVQQQPLAQRPRPPTTLLPASGWIQPQQRQPNPTRFSLHQAHLRSPVLQAHSAESPLYHFVQGYIKAPTRLTNAGKAVERWTFTLDPEVARCIPPLVPRAPGEPDHRAVNTQSKTVRLRCIKWPATDLPDEHVWSTTDTSWIPYSYFSCNGKLLEQRKKVHHGKDLPIDITAFLKEGGNVLEITVMTQLDDTSYQNYLVAIEFLGVISHNSIKQRCLGEYRIPAQQVLAKIKNKLAGSSDDDDDIAIVESNLTINLLDPFSGYKMCDIPARSRACLHNDCFDLETFLTTRKRKGDACVPDQWRCPICSADARPHHLIVDGFLEEVKQALDAQGKSRTRAIIVQQDGSWKPKPEVRDPNGVSDRGLSDEPPTLVVGRASLPAQAEIIDLSD